MLTILRGGNQQKMNGALVAGDALDGGAGDLEALGDADLSRTMTISAAGFEALATCAVGRRVGDLTYLAYLSLLGPATTVVAIWANLMDHHQHAVSVEGVGQVQLWQRQPGLDDLGYHIGWRRRHHVLQLEHGARAVHLVTEPDLLTARDPQLADSTVRSRRHHGGHGGRGEEALAEDGGKGNKGGKGAKGGAQARLKAPPSSASAPAQGGAGKEEKGGKEAAEASAAQAQANEQAARERRPIFVLLGLPGDDEWSLARRHLLYLAERVQWLAYYEPWADFFWRRGLASGEITPLTVWPARADGERAFVGSAYLCQPDPMALAAALPSAIAPLAPVERDCIEKGGELALTA